MVLMYPKTTVLVEGTLSTHRTRKNIDKSVYLVYLVFSLSSKESVCKFLHLFQFCMSKSSTGEISVSYTYRTEEKCSIPGYSH